MAASNDLQPLAAYIKLHQLRVLLAGFIQRPIYSSVYHQAQSHTFTMMPGASHHMAPAELISNHCLSRSANVAGS